MILNLFGKKSAVKKAPAAIPSFIRIRALTYKCKSHKQPFTFASEGVEGIVEPAKTITCPKCKTAGKCELIAVGGIIKVIPVTGI